MSADPQLAALVVRIEHLQDALAVEVAERAKLAATVDAQEKKLSRAEVWGRAVFYGAIVAGAVLSDLDGLRAVVKRVLGL